MRTTDGALRFEYSAEHLNIVLELAAEYDIRAWDAAAFIVQQVFPQLTVLDSTRTPITTLDALPKHDGVDQASFHGASNFPLSVVPPAWFPKVGMPNVTVSGWHGRNTHATRHLGSEGQRRLFETRGPERDRPT